MDDPHLLQEGGLAGLAGAQKKELDLVAAVALLATDLRLLLRYVLRTSAYQGIFGTVPLCLCCRLSSSAPSLPDLQRARRLPFLLRRPEESNSQSGKPETLSLHKFILFLKSPFCKQYYPHHLLLQHPVVGFLGPSVHLHTGSVCSVCFVALVLLLRAGKSPPPTAGRAPVAPPSPHSTWGNTPSLSLSQREPAASPLCNAILTVQIQAIFCGAMAL